MGSSSTLDHDQIVTTIRSWPPAKRLRLAEAILGSLRQELDTPPPRGVPVEQVLGIAADGTPPPMTKLSGAGLRNSGGRSTHEGAS